jgi:hypothetical protein
VGLLFVLNLVILAGLQAAANQRIQENTRQIGRLLDSTRAASLPPRKAHSWDEATGDVGAPLVHSRGSLADSGKSDQQQPPPDSGANSRNVQLSILALQKQLAAVKALAEHNSQAAAAKEAKLASLEAAGRQLAQLLLTEANLTLCTPEEEVSSGQQQHQLTSPAEGIFRLEVGARVRASTIYANMKMFELRKNGSPLKNGGVFR